MLDTQMTSHKSATSAWQAQRTNVGDEARDPCGAGYFGDMRPAGSLTHIVSHSRNKVGNWLVAKSGTRSTATPSSDCLIETVKVY